MKSVEELRSKDISIMEFREKLFMEELEKYAAAITGEQESILPFVRDESGAYSEKKTWEFIRELTKCAFVYREYDKERLRQEYEEDGWADAEIEAAAGASFGFSEKEEEFLQSFLYCVIRIAEANPWRNTGGVTQTFRDFILFSGEHYEEAGRLYAAEAAAECSGDRYENLKGIYRPASWLIRLFTGKCLSDGYTEGEQKEYFGYLPAELREQLREFGVRPSELLGKITEGLDEEEIEKMGSQFEENYLEGLSEKERVRYEARRKREAQRRQKAEEEKERIRAEFICQEEFARRYLTFKKYRYAPEYDRICVMDADEISLTETVMGLDKLVKGMVRLFTESRGLSKIQDDNAYFTATALLKQSNKRFRKLTQAQAGRKGNV